MMLICGMMSLLFCFDKWIGASNRKHKGNVVKDILCDIKLMVKR